jgi:hypothetical protein
MKPFVHGSGLSQAKPDPGVYAVRVHGDGQVGQERGELSRQGSRSGEKVRYGREKGVDDASG